MKFRQLAVLMLIIIGNLYSDEYPALIGMEQFDFLKQIGHIEARRSESISHSRWGVQFNKYHVPQLEIMLERIAESGVKWARVETRSYPVEPADGYYKWTELDSVIDGLTRRKINIYITFDEKALGHWAESVQPLETHVIRLWLEYITQIVTRYKDRVKYWEIFNEPNLNVNYARLVIEASKTIKQIDPEAIILAGSLARMDVNGLGEILKHGAGPYINVITYHPYNEFPESVKYPFIYPIRKPENYMQGGNLISDLQKMLDAYNLTTTLWQGECGYPSAANSSGWQGRGPWGENIQAKWLLRRFMIDLSLDIPVSIYFILREPPEGDRYNAKGLLRLGTLDPKPAYRALQHVTSLFDQRFDQPRKLESKIVIDNLGSFSGVRGDYPQSFGAPYSNAKAPTPIEVIGVTGDNGNGIVYWLPWRMQEIVNPVKIDLYVKNIEIKNPVLVDLLTGKIFTIKFKRMNNDTCLSGIPLTDYPFVVLEKNMVSKVIR